MYSAVLLEIASDIEVPLWSKFCLFLGVSHRILWKNKKNRLPSANTCIGYGDIQICKLCKVCKWDDWLCHTRNPILHHVYKQSYLGQFAAQIIENWLANSSTENKATAIKHFVALATHSLPVLIRLISVYKWF